MVEPLTMAAALFVAAELVLGKLGGKALDAALSPADEALKTQVKALTGKSLSQVRQNAFQEAVKKARADFLAAVSEADAELAGRLMTVFCPEDEESARDLELPPQFIVEAQKMDLFAEQPDLGALLAGYRRADATWWVSRGREVPDLDKVERLLQDFLAYLRQRLRDDPVWGPLSLTAAKLRAVERIDETLTEELPAIRKMTEELPTIRQLVARLEETMRQAHRQLPRKSLVETTSAYLTYLRDRYQYLAFRGMGLSERVPLQLPLVEMYVPLFARPELPPGETWERKQLQLAAFELDLEANLWQLHHELRTATYHPGGYHHFYMQERKRRLVSAASFRDRVVHHALQRVIEPVFERRFISVCQDLRFALLPHPGDSGFSPQPAFCVGQAHPGRCAGFLRGLVGSSQGGPGSSYRGAAPCRCGTGETAPASSAEHGAQVPQVQSVRARQQVCGRDRPYAACLAQGNG